ncbi:hypothetical protein SB783_37565 [Paraburkholderia sp. SIMBA_009]
MATAWIYDRDYHRFEAHRVTPAEVRALAASGETLVCSDGDALAFIDSGRVMPWLPGQVQRIDGCEFPRGMFV